MFLAFSYAPFVIGMSKVQKYEHYDKDNNKTVAEKIKFMFTIDHRYIDGAVCAKLLLEFLLISNLLDYNAVAKLTLLYHNM